MNLKSILTVARNELADSIRSRRAIVLMIICFLGAMAATFIFIKALHEVENRVAETIGISKSNKAGTATSALWKSEHFREIIIHFCSNDRKLAEDILNTPPLGVFFGWLAFAFGPAIAILLAGGRIAEEVWSGSVRFVLFRTSRISWATGKFLGQAVQFLIALLLGGLGVWLVGWYKFACFEPALNAWSIALFALKAWAYLMAFLGIALGVSMFVMGPNIAIAVGFIVVVVMTVIDVIVKYFPGAGWKQILEPLALLTPGFHKTDIWYYDLAHCVPAIVYVLVLGCLYFIIGYSRFSRKDM